MISDKTKFKNKIEDLIVINNFSLPTYYTNNRDLEAYLIGYRVLGHSETKAMYEITDQDGYNERIEIHLDIINRFILN